MNPRDLARARRYLETRGISVHHWSPHAIWTKWETLLDEDVTETTATLTHLLVPLPGKAAAWRGVRVGRFTRDHPVPMVGIRTALTALRDVAHCETNQPVFFQAHSWHARGALPVMQAQFRFASLLRAVSESLEDDRLSASFVAEVFSPELGGLPPLATVGGIAVFFEVAYVD